MKMREIDKTEHKNALLLTSFLCFKKEMKKK